MDWAKAKTILIIALVILNVFLCMAFGVFRKPIGSDNQEQNDLLAETMTLLEARDIDMKIDLPEAAGPHSIVTVDRVTLSERTIARLIANERELAPEERTEENIRAKARAFLEELGVWNDNTFIAKYEVGGDGSILLTFGSMVDGIPLELSNLYCYVANGRIAVVIGVWMIGHETGDRARETILPIDALLAFMGEVPRPRTPDGELIPLHITNMEMVYHFDSDSMANGLTVSDTAFPYWKFTYIVGSEEESVSELGAKIDVVTRMLYISAFRED